MVINTKMLDNVNNEYGSRLPLLAWGLLGLLVSFSVLYIYFVNIRLSESYMAGRIGDELARMQNTYQEAEASYIGRLAAVNGEAALEHGLVRPVASRFLDAHDGKLAQLDIAIR